MRSMGTLIKDLRAARGWSQGQLAEALCDASGRPTITREEVSRWERGVRVPGPFWLPHLADVLQAPQALLESERMRRRSFLHMATLVPIAGVLPVAFHDGRQVTADDMFGSIAGGDSGPLSSVQTSHELDRAVAALGSRDRGGIRRLFRWMDDGESDVLRVNATGILAKSSDAGALDSAALALMRDEGVRKRYLSAVMGRVGRGTSALMKEVLNPHDAGARWCAAFLLGHDNSSGATVALRSALRTEPVRENVRSIGLILNGVNPCN